MYKDSKNRATASPADASREPDHFLRNPNRALYVVDQLNCKRRGMILRHTIAEDHDAG
jgi:hypothetical protein